MPRLPVHTSRVPPPVETARTAHDRALTRMLRLAIEIGRFPPSDRRHGSAIERARRARAEYNAALADLTASLRYYGARDRLETIIRLLTNLADRPPYHGDANA